MRKYGLYLLIAVGLLVGCQKKYTAMDTTTAQTSAEETKTTESAKVTVPEESKTSGETDAKEPESTGKLDPIPIAVTGEYDGEWDDSQTPIITSRCDRVFVQGDGYEALKSALSAKNDEMAAAHKKEYEEYKVEAIDMRKEFTDAKFTYACNYEFQPIRFDGAVASMSWLKYYDMGGAHPTAYNDYYNFDTQTGKQLELSDMVKDMDGFRSYVKEELAGRAADGELFDGYEDTVDTLFDGTNADSSLEWAITENGVSVYFAPYEIGPYAAGEIEIAVPFKDHESMFEEAYMGASTDGWAKKVDPWDTVTYRSGDVDASVCYTYEEPETEDDFTRKLTIEREQNGKKDTFTEDVYGKIGDTWLVMTDDGRSYLYMELSSENDWKTMEVYDLNGEKVAKAGSSTDSVNGAPIQTPDAFYLTRRIDALGTYSAYRKFHVGADGMPEADGNVYTKIRTADSHEDEMPLVSTRALPVTLFGADGSETEATMPVGTKFYVRATDEETFVDMELEDGRKCRIAVRQSGDGWGFLIDGVSEEECFEFVPYAG